MVHCLRQIAADPGPGAGELAEAMVVPDFSPRGYFCASDDDGPYLEQVTLRGYRLSLNLGECYGGDAGAGSRYHFQFPGYRLIEEPDGRDSWIH